MRWWNNFKFSLPVFCAFLSSGQTSFCQDVYHCGAMKNVMWKGELFGTVALDTLTDPSHLYGIGPVENLTGEITVFDGVTYVATVAESGAAEVKPIAQIKAPFFVYTRVEKWREINLPDSVQNLVMLEHFLDAQFADQDIPFAFRLNGKISKALIHIMNLPAGTAVSKPEDAHAHRKYYTIKNTEADLIGFFSRHHQQIFTHKNSFIHVHLLSSNRQIMGHADEVYFKAKNLKIFVAN